MNYKDLQLCVICECRTPNKVCKPCLDNKFIQKKITLNESTIKQILHSNTRKKIDDVSITADDTFVIQFIKGESVTFWREECASYLKHGYIMEFITTHNDHQERPYVVAKFCKIKHLLDY